MIRDFLKRSYRIVLVFSIISPLSIYKYYDRHSSNIIWIRDNTLKYIFSTSFLWDLATIYALFKRGEKYRIVFGPKIGFSVSKNIFYTLHPRYGIYGFSDYTLDLHHVLKMLSKSNNLYPSYEEALLWENKAYMHTVFNENGIISPKTEILNLDNLTFEDLTYPFLLKEIHSCESKGLFKIENKSELDAYIASLQEQDLSNEILFQEILNMRKDLRVIVIGNKIAHYYWRINLSDNWRPTATSKGNKVDFLNFPEQHYDKIVSFAQRLNLTAAAFDIAWQNDDLSTDPIVLEVSPAFSPNPKTSLEYECLNYGLYKKKISYKGYDFNYVHLIFELKDAYFLALD